MKIRGKDLEQGKVAGFINQVGAGFLDDEKKKKKKKELNDGGRSGLKPSVGCKKYLKKN